MTQNGITTSIDRYVPAFDEVLNTDFGNGEEFYTWEPSIKRPGKNVTITKSTKWPMTKYDPYYDAKWSWDPNHWLNFKANVRFLMRTGRVWANLEWPDLEAIEEMMKEGTWRDYKWITM